MWNYIANKYGEQKIGEIFNRIKSSRSIDNGFKAAIGLSVKELSDRWQKEEKVLYWPDVAKREEPADFAFKRLTNHTKDGNFYNTSPAISPQGDKVVFISDRDDYFDVYLMSALDGEIIEKLVSGQKTNDFEELHLLTPGIAWSPDGKKIALAVKAGSRDAIMLVDVNTRKMERIDFDLDGIFSVNWSHNGKYLTFVGLKSPQSDIYLYDFETKQLTNLTNDIFSDMDPSFSADDRTIFFSSERGDFTSPAMLSKGFHIWQYESPETDIYSLDIASRMIRRITDQPHGSKLAPVVSPDGKKLLYIADLNGINNLYVQDLDSGKYYPITNSISGLYQPSLSADGSKLVFASLNEAGFDIYLMLRPFERKLNVAALEPTEFYKQKYQLPREEKPREVVSAAASSDTVGVRNKIVIVADTAGTETRFTNRSRPDLSGYVFSQESFRDSVNKPSRISQEVITDNQDSDSNYIPHRYKLHFSPDLVYGAAGYNTFFGLEGNTVLAFSDMLGDHQIVLETNLLLDLKNSDYGLAYYYLPGRIDWGFQAFHNAKFLLLGNPYDVTDTLYRFTTSGIGLSASYPVDRFNRFDLSLTWLSLTRDVLYYGSPSQQRNLILPSLSYVNDNSLWQGGWFGPNNGSRFNFTFYGTPKISSNGLDIQTFTADYRSYNRLWKDFIFAYRASGGISTGANKQNFFIGGTEGWINPSFHNNTLPIYNVEDLAFLTPVLPLRGFEYAQEVGTHYAVANMEFRFPLLKYLIFGALPIGFANILGTTFIDAGSAWTNTHDWQLWGRSPAGSTDFQDLLVGTGAGIRLFLFGIPLRMDVAWRFNWSGFSQPIYYFALGPDF